MWVLWRVRLRLLLLIWSLVESATKSQSAWLVTPSTPRSPIFDRPGGAWCASVLGR